MAERKHSDRIKMALEEYNDQHPDNPIIEHTPEKDDRNPIIKLWDKIGKTGQVIALVAGILTGLTTIKPYVEDGITFMGDFIYSVETTRDNTNRIVKLEKSNEVNMSITKSQLHPFYHTNPDGDKVKLYQTKPVHGKKMTYHFIDSLSMPLVANENLESGYWYIIDDSGNYSEIRK
tara:strand:+ start:2636 stop:3163 length:528 start_codon:yes stop_codon:yes gene_type:complete